MHDILLVDDDPNILQGLTRSLRGLYRVHTAQGGPAALELLRGETAFAVIVSDMRMPDMDGVHLLRHCKDLRPLTVRVMLTGNSDQDTAAQAVNEGNVFRFVTKPCSKEGILRTIESAVRQYELLTAERDLLEKTLAGSVQVLTEILSLLDARLFGRCTTLRELVRRCGSLLPPGELWEVETAAMLAPIGSVAIPPVVMARARQQANLTDAERRMLARIPEVGFQLLNHIPRLERVAAIVRHQTSDARENTPVGARLLRILHDVLDAAADDRPLHLAIADLRAAPQTYDQALLAEVEKLFAEGEGDAAPDAGDPTEAVTLGSLAPGRVTAQAILTAEGMVLVGAGQRITATILERLRNFAATIGLRDPILVQRIRTRVAAS